MFRMEFGDVDGREAFIYEPIPEGLLDVIFAMDDKDGFDLFGILAGKKLQQVFIVTVGAHAPDASDLRVDFVRDAVDVHLLCAGHKAAAEGTRFTIADKEDGITGVLDIVADMMH